MSNFICPTCGFTNIDCGKIGYKTDREIELEKKLSIAVKALKYYANRRTYDLCAMQQCSYVDGAVAQQALNKIEKRYKNMD